MRQAVQAGDMSTDKAYVHQKAMLSSDAPDHYELLQISPNAEPETIHRVYRLLAQRYHPDNAQTGNLARFQEVRDAYSVLSDPAQRARYDEEHEVLRRARTRLVDTAEHDLGRAPQIPAAGPVEPRLEVPGEVQHRLRVELRQVLDHQVGLLLGVAGGGLAGGVDDLPELRLVHHGTSIPGAGPARTRTAPDAPVPVTPG